MREIKRHKIEIREHYLVYVGYDWSPSGYDIAEVYIDGSLISQTNGENLLKFEKIKIYELPVTE